MATVDYVQVFEVLCEKLGKRKVTNQYHRRLAWSTDASYFRILPEIVVHADTLDEVKYCLATADRFNVAVTFRAAGTSLSGQALGSGILLILGFDGFRTLKINEDASRITLGVAVIGSEANAALKPFNRKIGPDPATLKVAKIGGIVANNSSGMCCGTTQNSYQTIISAKLLFADGSYLDTGSAASRQAFAHSHAQLLTALNALSAQTKADKTLSQRIKDKYAIKNTTGYSLNALTDFTDPFDIINHLIVGSEGTLAFIEEVEYRTVEDAAYKASALAIFNNIQDAANAASVLNNQPVAAVELFDYSSIKAIANHPLMPAQLAQLPTGAAMLLIETRARDQHQLDKNTEQVMQSLSRIDNHALIDFSDDAEVYGQYWALRAALLPIAAANRKQGTVVITEDIAFRNANLADAIADLNLLFQTYGYHEGIIFGHALVGNIHFVITPSLVHQQDIQRFGAFMQAVSDMVINKYDGSMKAEHGTGRAVSPFVAIEWGQTAYQLMQQIKQLFDPKGLLNPDVILTNAKDAHLTNIKPYAEVDGLIEKCIDCGFCEHSCPTSALSMSPRQRIATLREIARLRSTGQTDSADKLAAAAQYDVVTSCISCELCKLSCPVEIGMGELANNLRQSALSRMALAKLTLQANHFAATNQMVKLGLTAAQAMKTVVGPKLTKQTIKAVGSVAKFIPEHSVTLPKPTHYKFLPHQHQQHANLIYFPACGGRLFGAMPQDKDQTSLPSLVVSLCERAGFSVMIPDNTTSLCCGQLWQSKGDSDNAKRKQQQLLTELQRLSNNGSIPIVIDALSCTHQLINSTSSARQELQIFDLIDFIHDVLLNKLTINQQKPAISLHLGCSAQKMHITTKMQAIAQACSKEIVYPASIQCCGFAGDKGLYHPEIAATALRNLASLLPSKVTEGYYANRMCELGLSQHSNISYRHLAYLVEECTR